MSTKTCVTGNNFILHKALPAWLLLVYHSWFMSRNCFSMSLPHDRYFWVFGENDLFSVDKWYLWYDGENWTSRTVCCLLSRWRSNQAVPYVTMIIESVPSHPSASLMLTSCEEWIICGENADTSLSEWICSCKWRQIDIVRDGCQHWVWVCVCCRRPRLTEMAEDLVQVAHAIAAHRQVTHPSVFILEAYHLKLLSGWE